MACPAFVSQVRDVWVSLNVAFGQVPAAEVVRGPPRVALEGEAGLQRCLRFRKLEVQWLFSSPGPDFSVSLIIFHSIPCATSWLRAHIAARRGAWAPFWGGLAGFALCQLSVLVHLTATWLEMQTRVVATRC